MLGFLNKALLARTGDHARFATAAYGLLNCKTNILTIAGAGHPPALLSRFGGDPVALESKGPLLGVFETDDFPQTTLQLSQGDTLLLYSDGFEEALGNEEHAEGEFPTYLHSMHEFCIASGSEVIKNINVYLDNSIGNTANDDLTMICLQAKPTPVHIRSCCIIRTRNQLSTFLLHVFSNVHNSFREHIGFDMNTITFYERS